MVFLESPQIKTLIVNLILFLGFISNSNAQSDTCALIDLEAINGSKGDEICIQVKISNFKNVLSFQFPINFDPSVVQPVYVRNLYNLIGFSDQDINATKAFEGAIRVVWTNPNGDTITLPDTVLFEICFKIVGKPGDCSNIEMTNWPISSEIIQRDVNGNDTAGCIIDKNPFDQIKVSVPSHLCVSNSSCGTLTNTGNIIIKAWGGLAPYTVMSNNSIPPTNIILTKPGDCAYITNQAAGTYDFKVTDQNGEDSIFSVVISKTSSLVISNDISYTLDPVCWNKANGRVGINIIGGSGNYFIKWLPFNRYGIKRINGLLPGKYTVVVRDTNGCEEMKDFILRSDTLKGELTIDNRATCFGFCNGKATIKATGGTPFLGRRYEFVWSMHSIADCPIDTICHNDSLCGDQFVVIKDSRGCKDTIDFTIPFSGNLTDSLIIDSVLCFGDQNGRITAFVQSPSPLKQPIVFELRDASNNIIMGGLNFGAQYQSPGLGAGTYFLTTTDSVGCFHIDTIKIFQPAILDYLENQIDTTESCNPGGDALLDVRGVGGTQPYSYSWSNGEKTNRNSNLTLGTYTLTITDAHLCTITKTYTVSKPVGPTITGFNNKDVNCLGDTSGCVEVLFTQGSSPVIINWNFGGGNNSRICQLGAGTYTVTLTDQSGCSDTASTTINTGTNSIVIDSFVLVNPSCPGKSDGLIIVFAKGGSGLLTYAWNNGITTLVNASIKAGSYIVTVDDIGGCPGITDTFNLVDRPKPSIQVNTIIEPSCAETASCDASALVTVNTSDSIVVVSWSSGEQKRYVSKSGTFQDTAKNLCSGRQYAIISVNDLCSDTVFFDIKIPPRISLDSNQLSLTKPSCYGRKDGSISIAAKGGCTPYIYNWTNPVITGPTLNNVGDGFYRVKITDCRGCVHFDSVRLRQPDTIRVQVILGSTFDVSCPGKQDGKITLVWNGGSGGTGRFNWNPNVGTDSVLTNLSA
ncbi:MAG: cohesin domain-containing protein, partial [Saprospiraceae bacterium]